jgi:hypothetical protein
LQHEVENVEALLVVVSDRRGMNQSGGAMAGQWRCCGVCSQRIEKKRNQGEAARGRRKRRARVFAAPRMRNKRGGGGGGAVVGGEDHGAHVASVGKEEDKDEKKEDRRGMGWMVGCQGKKRWAEGERELPSWVGLRERKRPER